MDATDTLMDWWKATGAGHDTYSPSPAKAVQKLIERYEISLPEDFRGYLLRAVHSCWDDEQGNWWPAELIRSVPDPSQEVSLLPNGGERFLLFLDHMHESWSWAISCEKDETFGKVAVIGGLNVGGKHDRIVADSFSDFIQRYIGDWRSVC